MSGETEHTLTSASKAVLRNLIPDFLLKQRSIVLRLGPRAGKTYAGLCLRDVLGIRTANQRLVSPAARSFLFVCFGNIMRSAMAEFIMRNALAASGSEEAERVRIASGGLHALPGREAHEWAQQAAGELGIPLSQHRAKAITREMVENADCVFAMDFQNKAELLTLYPEAEQKIYMLSAYAEGAWRYREIPDPYLGSLDTTRHCARQLQTCIQNLLAATVLSGVASQEQPVLPR